MGSDSDKHSDGGQFGWLPSTSWCSQRLSVPVWFAASWQRAAAEGSLGISLDGKFLSLVVVLLWHFWSLSTKLWTNPL